MEKNIGRKARNKDKEKWNNGMEIEINKKKEWGRIKERKKVIKEEKLGIKKKRNWRMKRKKEEIKKERVRKKGKKKVKQLT